MEREKAVLAARFGRKYNDIDKDKKAANRRLNAKKAIHDAIRGYERKSLHDWK